MPGDEITGFVTRGNGVSVHRADCVNLQHLLQSQPERLVNVRWSPREGSQFLVAIQVEALDRTGLLSDVTRSISDQHVNILSATVTTTRDRVAFSQFTFEMGDPKHLGARAARRPLHRRRLRRLPRHQLARRSPAAAGPLEHARISTDRRIGWPRSWPVPVAACGWRAAVSARCRLARAAPRQRASCRLPT